MPIVAVTASVTVSNGKFSHFLQVINQNSDVSQFITKPKNSIQALKNYAQLKQIPNKLQNIFIRSEFFLYQWDAMLHNIYHPHTV